MEKQETILTDLKEYHLLWKENSDRLNHLELLRTIAEAAEPLTRPQIEALFLQCCILKEDQDGLSALSEHGRPDCCKKEDPKMAAVLHSQAWTKYCDYRAVIAPQLAKNRQKMCRIEEEISLLPDPLEREVLRLRYLDGCGCRLTPWKLVALRLYGDSDAAAVQYVRRLHDVALQSLTAA